MKAIKRDSCLFCGLGIEDIYTIDKFPIFMGTTNESYENDVFEDMTFSKCVSCGCVQLKNLIPLDVLYEKSHNAAIGETWDRHHLEFYRFIKDYAKGTLVEIGGGNLKLANHLKNESSVDSIVVFDTNSYGENTSNKIVLKEEFFDINTSPKADMVIHSHLLEHLYNPVSELKNMGKLLDEGSYMAIAVPLIDKMLEDNFTNAINFEHTYITTYELIEDILNKSGFNIIDNKNFSPYISFIVAQKTKKERGGFKVYNRQLGIFHGFVEYHQKEVSRIVDILDESKEKDIFIFGAHIFTQYLIGFGLDQHLFKNVLDNDKNKIGNRLYGTKLNVKSPKILKDLESPIVVLKAAQYTEEIKKDILENINKNTRFIL